MGRLLLYDALPCDSVRSASGAIPTAALCGTQPTITALLDYEEFCGRDTAALVASAA